MGGSASKSNEGLDELLKDLVEAMGNCQDALKSATAPLDENGNPLKIYCRGEWDNLACWPNSPPGPVSISCPEHIAEFNQDAVARRHCTETGEWHFSTEFNKTWVQYSQCHPNIPPEDDIMIELKEGAPAVQRLVQLYTVGYSFTLVSLTFAMFILAYFPKLHCTRNYIHMHLFASFMLRAIIIFVKDKVLFIGSGILDVNSSKPDELLDDLLGKMKDGNNAYVVGCKIVMTLFHYFLATNYYWVLVEALHLHSLIFLTVFTEKKYIWKFILIGWGAPVLFVGPWAIVRATVADEKCWDISIPEYKWIYNGPIVIANVVNFLLFLNIIRVLWYKMRENGVINGMDDRKKYRKLAKSTLVLIFMFGVHAIVFIGVPDSVEDGWLWTLRMYFDLFFNSFQGFFVAIIYCFCNGEVQTEFKKAWQRFHLSVEMQRGNREKRRSSVTGLTTFISSASHQARLSIAGQGRRCSNTHKNSGQTINNNCCSTSTNGYSSDYRMPLLHQSESQNCHSTATEDTVLSLGEDEQLPGYLSRIGDREVSNSKNDSQQEDVEEKAFELALESRSEEHPADLGLDENDYQSESRKSSTTAESSDQKRKRTPSFDSGISVMAGGHPRLSRGLSSNSESPTKESTYDHNAV